MPIVKFLRHDSGPRRGVGKCHLTPACGTNTSVANQQHMKAHSGINFFFTAPSGNEVFVSLREEDRKDCFRFRAPEVSDITAEAAGTVPRHSHYLFRDPPRVDVESCGERAGGPAPDVVRLRLRTALVIPWWRSTFQDEYTSKGDAQ